MVVEDVVLDLVVVREPEVAVRALSRCIGHVSVLAPSAADRKDRTSPPTPTIWAPSSQPPIPGALVPGGRERAHPDSGRDDVEAEAEGDADLARVERDEPHRRRHPLGRGRCTALVSRTGCSRARAAARSSAPLVDGDDVEVVPGQPDGVLEVGAEHGLVGQPVDRRQGLGERERRTRSTPRRRPAPRARHARGGPSMASASSALGVEGDRHRGSPAARRGRGRCARRTRSARPPAAATASCGGAGRRRRWRSAGRGPGRRRRSVRAAPSGRPPTVTTMRSPSAARRTAVGQLSRGAHGSDPCGHTCTQADLDRPRQAGHPPVHELRLHRGAGRAAQDRPGRSSRPRAPRRPSASRWRPSRATTTAVWKQMAEQLGLQGLTIPEEFGGSGLRLRRARHRARGDGPRARCARRSSRPSCSPPTRCCSRATTRPRRSTCRASPSGETIATLAFTEPNGKWDESGIEATATKDGDAWKLNGTKMFVLDGHTADLIIVAAKTDKGTSLFAVDGDAAGPHPHRRSRRWTRPASRPSSSSPTSPGDADRHRGRGLGRALHRPRPRRRRPRRRAGRRRAEGASRWPSSTPRCACSSAARSARSRPSSTSAPTCCSRSSRPSRPPTTACGARRR